jgi:hypothetical protein
LSYVMAEVCIATKALAIETERLFNRGLFRFWAGHCLG